MQLRPLGRIRRRLRNLLKGMKLGMPVPTRPNINLGTAALTTSVA
jgi:hypothetical protein